MTLATDNRTLFDSGVRSRGDAMVRVVKDVRQSGRTISTRVRSSAGGGSYAVKIELTSDSTDAEQFSCTCPYFEGVGPCKHVWAVLRYIDQHSAELTGVPEVPKTRASRSSSRSASNSPASSRTEVSSNAPASRTPEWMTILSQLEEKTTDWSSQSPAFRGPEQERQQFWYIINVDSTLNSQNITLDLMTQQLRGNGQPGMVKDFCLEDRSISSVASIEHRELLAELNRMHGGDWFPSFGYGFRRPVAAVNRVVIRPLMQQALLSKMAETGRLCWRLSSQVPVDSVQFVAFDEDGIWEPSIEFVRKPASREWIITGRLIQKHQASDDVQQVRPLTDLLWLSPSGLALFPNTLSRVHVTSNYGWLQMLRRRAELHIPFEDHAAFVSRVAQTAALCRMPLPEEFCPCRTDVVCQPRLQLKSPTSLHPQLHHRPFIFGSIDFLYDGHPVAVDESSPLIATDGAMIRRDPAAESAHLNALVDLGATQIRLQPDDGSINLQLPEKQASSILLKLLELNWDVEAEGSKLRRPGTFRMGVSSAVDWFDLNAELDFGDASATLPALLAAVRNGQRFVKLGDGSRGMLPEKWLERYSTLVSLGQIEGDTIRFRPSQAMILEAMLEAQEQVTRDRDFRVWCKKLREFSGIRQKPAPRTFRGELRDYQKDGLSWLGFLNEFRLGGCLADDMGLGKTVQVLALLESRRTRRLKADEVRRPSLVVVPKSLIFNWIQEAARFAPQLKVVNHTGLMRHGTELSEADVVLTTYGTLRRDIVTIEKIHFDYVILDEAQAIKNADSQSAMVCRLLQSDFRLAMTGTPVENHLGELWSLFEFLNPGMLGGSHAFQRLTSSRDEEERAAALGMLSRAMRPFLLRRTKSQVLKELPGKTEQTLYCEMAPKQKKLYTELKKYYQVQLTQKIEEVGLKRAKFQVLEALLRLRQAACHPGLIDPKRGKEESGKLEAILEQLTGIAADGHKALVFSQFTSLLAIVRRRLDKNRIRYEYLDGKTTRRREAVERFQSDPSCPLFLISLKAGGHGLNLTAADYVFILDPWWNPAVEAQAVDRAHRLGQDRHVFAYRLISRDTVEERILEMQKEKRELAEAVISEDASLIRSLTAEDLTLLLS